jgi:hypothetical protein
VNLNGNACISQILVFLNGNNATEFKWLLVVAEKNSVIIA